MKLEWPNVNEKLILAEMIFGRFSRNTFIYEKKEEDIK